MVTYARLWRTFAHTNAPISLCIPYAICQTKDKKKKRLFLKFLFFEFELHLRGWFQLTPFPSFRLSCREPEASPRWGICSAVSKWHYARCLYNQRPHTPRSRSWVKPAACSFAM